MGQKVQHPQQGASSQRPRALRVPTQPELVRVTVTSGVPAGLQDRQRTRQRRLAVRSRVPWWAGTALPQSQSPWKRLVMGLWDKSSRI